MATNEDIKVWKNKLLDLSKKNNLINYKYTKSSILEILSPSFYDLFNRISTYQSTMIYETQDDTSDDLYDKETS